MPRFYIHDYGFINALGKDKHDIVENWQNLHSPGMVMSEAFFTGHASMLGTVPTTLVEIPEEFSSYNSRNNQLLLQSLMQIKNSVEKLRSSYGSDRIAIVLGTSTSGIGHSETALKAYLKNGKAPDDYHFLQQDIGSGADFLQQYLKFEGPCVTVSTACSSSGNAFATARRLIKSGFCDAAIVGGADSLCQMTVQGFNALNSVSIDRCQPFSQNRSGINIGEASALFILSQEPADIELYGVGCSSDAHHISAPEPSGKGAVAAIGDALEQSPFSSADIDYINMHGTATPLNDAMESQAIHHLFGDDTLCSSTKSLTGHTLGAAAATELALCLSLLDTQIEFDQLPAQLWDGVLDPELPCIKIADGKNQDKKIQICLSNSFAFGGNNTAVIIGRRYESL